MEKKQFERYTRNLGLTKEIKLVREPPKAYATTGEAKTLQRPGELYHLFRELRKEVEQLTNLDLKLLQEVFDEYAGQALKLIYNNRD